MPEPDAGGPAPTGSDERSAAHGQPTSALDPQLLQASAAASEAARPLVQPATYKWQALRTKWLATRYPLVAVALLLLVVSLPRTTEAVVAVITRYPAAGTAALLLWILYAFPLIWVVNRFDFFEREPMTLIAMALAWGGVIATSMAVQANAAVFSLLTSWFGEAFTQRWGAALAAPSTEELLKAIGIVAVILLALRGVRSAIDGFVVGAMVGLGFQVVENFVYTGNLLLASGVSGEPFATVMNVFFVRGIGAGLWSHAVYSGVAGLGIGYAVTRNDRSIGRRLFVAAAMLGLAWFMHFVWNLPSLLENAQALAPLVKAAIILALLGLVIVRSQGRESYIYTGFLEAVQDPQIITDAEIEQLRTYQSREAAVRAAGRRGGERAADAARMLQRAQADLSVALATGDLPRVAEAKQRIAQARSRRSEAELLPPDVGYGWGVASIWTSILGVLIPIIGPLVAAVLAWIGLHEARSRGAGVASTVRAAWPIAGVSLALGVVLLLII